MSCDQFLFCSRRALVGLAMSLCAAACHAEIPCFCDFLDYTLERYDTAVLPAISDDTIEITGAAGGEKRGLFHNVKQDITQFTASFIYQATDGRTDFDFHPSTAFVIHNDPAGASAIGNGAFGYAGISNSVAVSFQLVSSGATSASASGVYTDGNVGGGSPDTSPVNFQKYHPIEVTITYDGTFLRETLRDTDTDEEYARTSLLNLPQVVGGTTAYVGFTAVTQNFTTHRQILSKFRFSNVPEPGSMMLIAMGSAMAGPILRRRRREQK